MMDDAARAWARHVIWRDLKLENCLMDEKAAGFANKLDRGIAMKSSSTPKVLVLVAISDSSFELIWHSDVYGRPYVHILQVSTIQVAIFQLLRW